MPRAVRHAPARARSTERPTRPISFASAGATPSIPLLGKRLQLSDRRVIAIPVAHLNQAEIHRVFIGISRLIFGLTHAGPRLVAGSEADYLSRSGDCFEIGPFFPADLLLARL